MTHINSYSYSPKGVVSNNQNAAEKGDANLTTAQNQQQAANTNTQVSGSDVLNYMAAQNAAFVPTGGPKTVNVSDYVNAEQKTRIEDFMKGFEADYEEMLALTLEEFPDLSEGAAGAIALGYIDETY